MKTAFGRWDSRTFGKAPERTAGGQISAAFVQKERDCIVEVRQPKFLPTVPHNLFY